VGRGAGQVRLGEFVAQQPGADPFCHDRVRRR
jgi:hypothetical protein